MDDLDSFMSWPWRFILFLLTFPLRFLGLDFNWNIR